MKNIKIEKNNMSSFRPSTTSYHRREYDYSGKSLNISQTKSKVRQ